MKPTSKHRDHRKLRLGPPGASGPYSPAEIRALRRAARALPCARVRRGHGDPRSSPRRRQRQLALVPRVAGPEDNPRHAGLELWMAAYGHQIISRPASEFDRYEGRLTVTG